MILFYCRKISCQMIWDLIRLANLLEEGLKETVCNHGFDYS